MTGPRLRETPITRQAQDVVEILNESPLFREAASAINRAIEIEDRHWQSIVGGGGEYEGPSLDDLQDISKEIRLAMLKSPLVDRGAQLRHSYVWSKGVKLPDAKPDTHTGPRNAADRVYSAFANSINQSNVFSDTAHEEMERALYSDGAFFLLGDTATKTLRRVPFSEITDFLINPDFGDEVWAWQRTWRSVDRLGKTEEKKVWYYTDDCPQPRSKRADEIQDVLVDHGKHFLVHAVNRQVGWPLGIPDAVGIIAWAKLYSEFMKYGYIMNRALATIAFTATPQTKKQGEKTAVRMASANGAGQTAIGANITPVATAGRGYDFDAGRPIAALVATGVQVSIVHLLSDPGAAGSSYGSASNLDLPTKRAVVARQKSWVAFFQRVLTWLGATDPKVTFPALEEADFYREMQGLVLGWNSGLLHPEEVRVRLIELLNIVTDQADAPDGVMLPNNEKSILRPDVDGDGQTDPASSPDQGRSNGAGRRKDSHDLETPAEALSRLEISEKLEQLLEIVSARHSD